VFPVKSVSVSTLVLQLVFPVRLSFLSVSSVSQLLSVFSALKVIMRILPPVFHVVWGAVSV
jgi:hypothetical protein